MKNLYTLYNAYHFQVEDIAMMNNGALFFTCNDSVTRDSSDRNIMAWDFNKAVVLSNQIYQVRTAVQESLFVRIKHEILALREKALREKEMSTQNDLKIDYF